MLRDYEMLPGRHPYFHELPIGTIFEPVLIVRHCMANYTNGDVEAAKELCRKRAYRKISDSPGPPISFERNIENPDGTTGFLSTNTDVVILYDFVML